MLEQLNTQLTLHMHAPANIRDLFVSDQLFLREVHLERNDKFSSRGNHIVRGSKSFWGGDGVESELHGHRCDRFHCVRELGEWTVPIDYVCCA